MGHPVIFVHGIGATAKVWKEFPIPNHSSFYITFSNRFSSPKKQVPELAAFINKVLEQTGAKKVILVCHSMGGLVVREYLSKNKDTHRVEKVIFFSVPNLGTIGLTFNWVPISLIIIGLIGYSSIFTLFLLFLGLLWEIISYSRGVLLLSPAAWSMRKNSSYLKFLNSKTLPENIKYIVVLSQTRRFPHILVNMLLFQESGDGAIPISSQKLSKKSIVNFNKLNYHELTTNLPHFKIPRNCEEVLLKALSI